ncbi:MAG: YciI family protein [Rhodothermales bacterium]
MKYYLLMYADEKGGASLPKAEMDAWIAKIVAWNEEMRAAGVLVRSEGLMPTSAASTIRVRDGKTLTTHGPFAETKEQLGGFHLIDCPNLDEAIEWAARAPGALFGSVEIRPVWDMKLEDAVEAARDQGFINTK